jgi:NADH/NAD ratio-sensing transcriptional regulator Rex
LGSSGGPESATTWANSATRFAESSAPIACGTCCSSAELAWPSAYRARKKGIKCHVFDSDPGKVGRPVPSMPDMIVQSVDSIPQLVREKDIRLAIVAVPAESAQKVAEILVASGIRGLLNFAPVSLDINSDVAVCAVDLAVQLEQLSFLVGAGAE